MRGLILAARCAVNGWAKPAVDGAYASVINSRLNFQMVFGVTILRQRSLKSINKRTVLYLLSLR
jgi:hypothetical protein